MVKKALIVCAAILAMAMLAGGTAHAAKMKAKLTRLKGDVQVKATATASWKAANSGDVVNEGAQIKSGAGAEVYVAWGSGHVLKVGAQSTVTLTQLEKGASGETNKIGLEKGKVFANAKKLQSGSSFEIKTPTAVAGVRGTGFECSDTSVVVVDGTVAVSAGGETIEVDAGMLVEIPEAGEPFMEPAPIPMDMMTTLESDLSETNDVSVEISAELETLTEEGGDEEAGEETDEGGDEEAGEGDEEGMDEGMDEEGDVTSDEDLDSALDSTDTALDLNVESSIVDSAEASGFQPGTGGIEIEIAY